MVSGMNRTKITAFYTAVPDHDGSKSQLSDWKILLVLTLFKVLKQCPKPSRYNLRNHMGTLLTPASVKFKVTLGDRAFKSSAPKLWNSLPLSIRNIQSLNKFKAQIKTYLFKLAFN